jgi:hypothetical protein
MHCSRDFHVIQFFFFFNSENFKKFLAVTDPEPETVGDGVRMDRGPRHGGLGPQLWGREKFLVVTDSEAARAPDGVTMSAWATDPA